MSDLTNAMAEVGKIIADAKAAIDPSHSAAVDAAIKELQAHDAAEDPKLADVIAGLQALHDAIIPPATPAPTETPEPIPAPTPEPTPAP